mgnify:FL=1
MRETVHPSSSLLVLAMAILLAAPCGAMAEVLLTGPATLDKAGETYVVTQDISAPGTAFTIAASNITLDLGGHTVVYNTAPSSTPVYGVSVNYFVARVAIRNGTIIQGAGKSADSSAILFRGGTDGHNELDHLVIRVHGPYTTAIHAGFDTYAFNESRIHHNYIETHDATCTAGCGGPQGINVMAQERGGVEVYDNIVVGAHRGIALAYVGTAVGSLPSQVYRNRVQQARVIDCKAPYGIALFAQTHHVSVHHNEIVSDDGRGIILDGWSQSGRGGASGNLVTDNRVDVQYSSAATIGGCYPNHESYGIRDRYESGENTIQGNTVLVTSGNGSPVWGWYVGSDTADPFMHDIAIRQNVTIVRKGTAPPGRSTVFKWDVAESVACDANRYLTDDAVSLTPERVANLTFTNNTPLTIPPSSALASPSGLALARCLNSYVLTWNANPEPDVFEYVVYRDGAKLPISPRGGTFYVDVDAALSGPHSYAAGALALSGLEGPRSAALSTASAGACLGAIVSDTLAPTAPTNLTVQ